MVSGRTSVLLAMTWRHTREAERTFRLDRIIEVAVEVPKGIKKVGKLKSLPFIISRLILLLNKQTQIMVKQSK